MHTTQQQFFVPAPNAHARPEDVVAVVTHYARQAGVEPTNADFARGGYWAAIGRQNDGMIAAGWAPPNPTVKP